MTYYDPAVEYHACTRVFVAIAGCTLAIFFQSFFSFCIPQDFAGGVFHVVDFKGCTLCTFLLNHTRLERMVFGTSNGFCIISYLQNTEHVFREL